MKTAPLNIASVPLNPKRIDRAFVDSTREAVENSRVRKGQSQTARILDTWTASESLSAEQYQKLDGYVDSVHTRYDKLQSEWWKQKKAGNRRSVENVLERMGPEAEVLMHHQKLDTELREANARAAVQAMAGTLCGVPGLLAAYAAYANGPSWTGTETAATEAVLRETEALNAGESTMITRNNSVKQVHREELWKSMHDMLDGSIEQAQLGRPMEVDLQMYELTSFEMIDRIADAARAGNKVRLNLDAGRLDYPSRDSDGETYFSLDATPDKIRTIIQLATIPDADIAVSLFPQKRELNSPTDLMHRKVIRAGDQVLVSGMNANLGSGENIDSGYLVRGEGAARLAENLARDVQISKGATLEDIWGSHHIDKFDGTNLRLGKRGFISLLDSVGGPSPAGTRLPKVETVEQLEDMAAKAGVVFADLIAVKAGDYEKDVAKMLSGRHHLQLSKEGKRLLKGQILRAIEVTNSPRNLERLSDMQPPSIGNAGTTRVDIADAPVERESLLLSAISQAEKFAYMPAFVITRAVASALVARRDQLKAAGKSFEVKVLADAGLYPHGSNPNSYGVKFLEDHGIQPRWAKLERSSDHDRKIHAKQLITDKGEITGSTNFSTQGMRENWETSAYIHFDEESKAAQDKSLAQFNELWDHNSFELNTRAHSAYLNREKTGPGREWFIEEGREQSVRLILRMIGNYERETGKLHQELLHTRPALAKRKDELMEQGYSYGDAALRAIREGLGEETHRSLLEELGTSQTLAKLQAEVKAFEEG